MKKNKKKSHKGLIITLTSIVVVIVAAVSAFFIYVSNYYHAEDECADYLEDSTLVDVEKNDNYIMFKPKINLLNVGYVFYPGGKVEYTSYAPMLNELAKTGITTFLVKMPFNLAVLDSDAANDIQSKYTSISNWFIGGHSLGGAMASSYVSSNVDKYTGLILLGAYSTKDLSSADLYCLSITATEDKIMNWDKYNDNKKNLPADKTTDYSIEGGNHSNFGDYGHQNGDGEASITNAQQRSLINTATVAFIDLATIASKI